MSISQEKKAEILEKINQHQRQIKEFLKKINESKKLEDVISLYLKILELDNTKEDYALNYLLCIKKSIQNKISTKYFEDELRKYEICISDKAYIENFSDFPRKNAVKKILDFIDIIKNSSTENDNQKSLIIQNIVICLNNINNSYFINKKKITWDNKELYLNSLYKLLVTSVGSLIIHFNEVDLEEEVFKDEYYVSMKEKYNEAIKKNEEANVKILKTILTNFLLLHSNYFNYIGKLKEFLIGVDNEFCQRFGNFGLDSKEDQLLFEDYIYFLGTYKFEKDYYISFWKETFVPSNPENLKEKLNQKLFGVKCELLDEGKNVRISDSFEKITIEPQKYNLEAYILYAKHNDSSKLQYCLNKFMKPNYYNQELFVSKTKKTWKNLLVEIFKSQTYKEVRNSLFEVDQVDIFYIDDIINDIIDNIKFFIYDTTFLGSTNNNTNTICEYGNINLNIKKKTVAILIFYGFHIIINIHEIGGHLNIKYQFFISNNKTFDSPEIKVDTPNYDKYSDHAKEKKKESGERIEIELFGEVKDKLTIKEVLFILNKDNYSLSLTKFKENYQKCKDKSIEALLNDSLKKLLCELGINYKMLDDKDSASYPYALKRKSGQTGQYQDSKSRHSPIFYYDMKKDLDNFFENYSLDQSKIQQFNK